MNNILAKYKIVSYLSLFTVIAGGLGMFILKHFLPDSYFQEYPFIPLYFFLFGCITVYTLDACSHYKPQIRLWLYLAIKVIKIIVSIIALVIYCLFVDVNIKVFLLTFVVYYLLYLIVETCFYLRFKKVWDTKKGD